MAHAESDVKPPTRLPTLMVSAEGSSGPIPMNCRGMELLGFACNETVYFCVHQCSVELWKLYDTPRVSIQKKILDLRIQLTNCSREQIKQLREAGIIENFRATMIALRDTERLFDALEYSRKKRGLLKHALKAKSDPSQRILRVEERRARRLKAKSLVCEEPKRVHADSSASAREKFSPDECALIGDTEVSDVYYCADRLLVAEDAVETLDIKYEHSIEVVSNDVQLAGELDVQQNCVPIHRMEHSSSLDISSSADHQYACSLESPRGSESSFPFLPCSKSITSRSRLSSPTFEASEVEEIRSTCSTYSNSLRSLSGSPKRQSATPDRFLFLDSDSDSEGESELTDSSVLPLNPLVANTGVAGPPGGSQSVLHSGWTTDFGVQNSTGVLVEDLTSEFRSKNHGSSPPTLNHKRPIVLKLRHLAQATSPSSQATVVNLPSSKSLIVSVPLSLLKDCTGASNTSGNNFQKGKREVALSSFVTKKRANSRTLSSSSEGSVCSDPTYYPRAGSMARKSRGRVKQHGNISKQTLKSRRHSGPKGQNRSKSDEVVPVISTDLGKARSDPAPSRRWSAAGKEEHSPMDVGLPWNLVETRLCQKEKAAGEKVTGSTCVSASCNSNENNRTHAITGNFAEQYGSSEPQSNGTSNGCSPQDDDQLSVTSSSTNSTTSSFKGGTSSRRSTRNQITFKAGKNDLDTTSMKFTFCFEDLFSYCPPKLILKDGELVPEKSLLAKDLSRHNIPEGHPLLKWTLGQPVKGAAVAKKIASRKRRGCKHLEK